MSKAFDNSCYHKSVLTAEVVANMNIQPGGIYIDATFGGGGHTCAILDAEPTARVIAMDWDERAIEENKELVGEERLSRIRFVRGNFAKILMHMKRIGVDEVNGIIADFGTSQQQLVRSAGFSFASNTPLDMRMSPHHGSTTAADIVNRATEKELVHIFSEYGEEQYSGRIARTIVEKRVIQRIVTTDQLVKIIFSCVPSRNERSRIHPATKVFQALRIAVNKELENIEFLLNQSSQLIVPGGRLVCISFHSLEDRIVKQYMRAYKHLWEEVTRKATIQASEAELLANPSARSAKMRVAERKN